MPDIDVSQYVEKLRKGEKSSLEDSIIHKEGEAKTTIEIVNGDSYYLYQKNDNTNNPTMPLYQTAIAKKQPPSDSCKIDFRILGFLPLGLNAGSSSYYSFIGNLKELNDRKITMTDDILNGIECKKVLCFKEGYYLAVWFAVKCGYSPIQMESESKQYKILDRTTVDVTRYNESSDLWVPVHSVVERFEDGKLYRRTEYTIAVYSLNEPLDPKVFTPEGLDVPVGTSVEMTSAADKKMLLWDGKKAVTTGELSIAQMQEEKTVRFNRGRYLLIASGLALICSVCLYKFFTLRKQ
jgi:hypothetical protein